MKQISLQSLGMIALLLLLFVTVGCGPTGEPAPSGTVVPSD